MTMVATPSNTYIADWEELTAQRGSKRKRGTARGASKPAVTISMRAKPTQVLGIGPAGDAYLVSSIAANPTRQFYWYVYIVSNDGVSAPVGHFEIKCSYRTRWSQRISLVY
jgi:hypothetical protein